MSDTEKIEQHFTEYPAVILMADYQCKDKTTHALARYGRYGQIRQTGIRSTRYDGSIRALTQPFANIAFFNPKKIQNGIVLIREPYYTMA